MNLKKQSLVIFTVIALVGGIQWFLKTNYNHTSSPEKLAHYFISHHLDKKEILPLVVEEDKSVLQREDIDYVRIAKLSSSPYLDLETKAIVALSLVETKVDIQTNQGLVSVLIIKNNEEYKVFLNLKKTYEIEVLTQQIQEAELKEDEFEMLFLYKKMNELNPSDYYSDKITLIENYIAKKQKQQNYVREIHIDDLKIRGKTLTASIKNQGNENVKYIKGVLNIVNSDGLILREIPLSIYEVIPGSFVYGEPIRPHYMKNIGLDISALPEIKNVKMVYLTVLEVGFMEE